MMVFFVTMAFLGVCFGASSSYEAIDAIHKDGVIIFIIPELISRHSLSY